jgi:hypothetical protein
MLDAQVPTRYSGQHCQSTPQQAQSAGLWDSRGAAATASDDVIVQGYCTIDRQGAPAIDAGTIIQSDAGEREDISLERLARLSNRV